VTLCPALGRLDVEVAVLRERLLDMRDFLRSEVAAAIQRKRTPELAVQIVPRGDEEVTP
jgi:hypothetical protein